MEILDIRWLDIDISYPFLPYILTYMYFLDIKSFLDNETNKVYILEVNLKEEKELLYKQLNKISKLNYSFLIEDKREDEIKEVV